MKTSYFIIANFGNDSIALIQWARQQCLSPLFVISVDTGWAAPDWQNRIDLIQAYLKKNDIQSIRLKPDYPFQALVRERKNFPSIKFHWCASFLKGLPILDALDNLDPDLAGVILLAKRREQAAALKDLPEIIEESDAYGSRKVWHPLYNYTLSQRNELILQAGFDLIPSRSLECDPCIYNQCRDFKRLSPIRQKELADLEKEIGLSMFSQAIDKIIASDFSDVDLGQGDKSVYYQGCGSEFACGD